MSDSTTSSEPGSDTPEDDQKRKFREALERKRAQARSGDQHGHDGQNQHAHGPAAAKRNFRRKSG